MDEELSAELLRTRRPGSGRPHVAAARTRLLAAEGLTEEQDDESAGGG